VGAPGPSALVPHGSQMGTSGGHCRRYRQHPLGGPPLTSPTSVAPAAGPAASTPRRPTVDIFNIGGGRCRTYRRYPQGARRRGLQLRWWPMSDLLPAPPWGPTIDVSNSVGGRCRTYRQHPLGGPPLTSPTLVVAAAGPASSTPQGPAIDVANSDGGVSLNLVPTTRIFLVTPTRGATMVDNTATSKEKWRLVKFFLGSLRCQERGSRNTITEKSKSTDNMTKVSIIRITKRGRKATAERKVYASSGSRSNCSATAHAACSTLSLAASADASTSPCTTCSREMLGSQLRKHINTWSDTACARVQPSSSRRLPTASSSWDIFLPTESRRGSTTPASGAAFPPRIGLKPKDARAASTWPRKLQTCCLSPAREARRSSRPF
jgi:hypothetical protein